MKSLTVIGCMSGTSLDGLDLCAVKFTQDEGIYDFEILCAETIAYADKLKTDLDQAFYKSPEELNQIDRNFGIFIGKGLDAFISRNNLEGQIDLIGSHGHTIFHDPSNEITVQIGDGQAIADEVALPVINNFRIKDVELGGQGAPLVPIGDKHLFGKYESCLNLGGISNISFDRNGERIAFDIGPANMPLNRIVKEKFGFEYDAGGKIAAKGEVNQELFTALENLEYYKIEPPKSLAREWIEGELFPQLNKFESISIEDKLRTLIEHEVAEIIRVFHKYAISSCLVTGGGAHNNLFIDRLKSLANTEVIIPQKELIEFKEALIFAFLAYLNANDQINTLASVTGASKDSIGGIKHIPN